ncbi:MAG: hypothetical protein ACI91Z_001422 [Yoonia sp.]|jgi:hypothetical protein
MPDPYVSEVKYQGGPSLDFVEIAVDAGTDVSSIFVTIYNPDGSVRSVNALGTSVGTQFGQDIYVIDTATSGTFNGLHKFGGVALEQDGTLVSFISFDNGSPITDHGDGRHCQYIDVDANRIGRWWTIARIHRWRCDLYHPSDTDVRCYPVLMSGHDGRDRNRTYRC